jgi:virulence factor Mce-like protein
MRGEAVKKVRRRMLGLALVMSVVLFLALTVAIYQKVLTSTVDVVLRAESTGNQLMPESDVKVRGMRVGEVREIRAVDGGAEMHLALDPDKADQIPANVSARLLPKTLFGERFVSLELPRKPSGAVLAAGDVIQQDRTQGSIELEKVLADTMPVLQAIRPDELAATLNALNQALEGRGRPLGETLTQLNTYLDGLNPSVPQLRDNLRELVGVANTYEQAAPDVLTALRNLSTTSRTLVDQRQNLNALTTQLTSTSRDTTGFLQANSQNLIRLNDSARPTLDVMAEYSPAYPCFLEGMARFVPRLNQVFGVGTDKPGLHITLEVVPNRGKYTPGEEPKFDDKRGPRCYDTDKIAKPFPQYPPDGGPVEDGSNPPPAAANPSNPGGASGPASTSPQSASSDLGVVNSPAERDFVSSVLAPSMGVRPGEVPPWGSMLVGPVLRGAEVSYR